MKELGIKIIDIFTLVMIVITMFGIYKTFRSKSNKEFKIVLKNMFWLNILIFGIYTGITLSFSATLLGITVILNILLVVIYISKNNQSKNNLKKM